MAAELGLVSLTQLQLERIAATQQLNHLNNPNPSSLSSSSSSSSAWMWNPKQQTKEDDDSWEVRAFEEDAGNIMGTTWPPRSYTCTFCRREFRSAQALGGHMNVHRRDRARLHQTPSNYQTPSSSSTYTSSSSTFIIPPQQFSSNGGLCLLYQLPNPNAVFSSTAVNACPINSPSTLLSVSQYPHNHHHHQIASRTVINSSQFYSNCKAEPATSILDSKEFVNEEEVDLELRLGHRSTSTSSSSPY